MLVFSVSQINIKKIIIAILGTTLASLALAQGVSKQLIGELEGVRILQDVVPAKYNEAPMLAELVKQGKLPPVGERVGKQPLVLKPIHETGQYGGTWKRGFIGPNDRANVTRAIFHDRVLHMNYDETKVVPNIARSWEQSADGKVTTIYLREGMKWSDGGPFTADDFVFWYEDLFKNKEFTPNPQADMLVGEHEVRVEKVDTYTLKYVSDVPYFMILFKMANTSPAFSGHGRWGYYGGGSFAPKHYMKQFHPKYAGEEVVAKLVEEAGLKSWVQLFKQKNSAYDNSELPVVSAWKVAEGYPRTSRLWKFERNPYSIWMDEAGNQLPYIDYIELHLGENLEVLNLQAMAGEYNSMARHMDLTKLPEFLENQEKGDYTVHLDTGAHGGEAFLCLNQTYGEDPEIRKWLSNVDFRRALSLGINRDEINEVMFLGLGTPGSLAPAEETLLSPGPDAEWRTLWASHDPDRANALLDEIGMDKKDAEGYRLRSDGKGRLRIEIATYLSFMNFVLMGEMIKEHWQEIGIFADAKEYERGFLGEQRNANKIPIMVEVTWAANNIFGHPPYVWPNAPDSCGGPLYGLWVATQGKQGEEPPEYLRQILEKNELAKQAKSQEEMIQLGKEMWMLAIDNVLGIGTVGLSPAIQGVRIVKNNMGNIPARQMNNANTSNPNISRPEQWFIRH